VVRKTQGVFRETGLAVEFAPNNIALAAKILQENRYRQLLSTPTLLFCLAHWLIDVKMWLCYTHSMSDTLTLRVPGREKDAWQKVANAVGEHLSEFARKAVRQRVQAVQAKSGSPWDDLLGSVSTDAPPATNRNVRKAMRSRRP